VACPEYLPAGHCVQLFAPGPENAPGWQPPHDDAPSPEENRPATHALHAMACPSGENSPAGQSAHDEARASAYSPSPHAVQAEAVNPANVPSWHVWQVMLAFWPENLPGVQCRHINSCGAIEGGVSIDKPARPGFPQPYVSRV
jgi:hypothetical protein